MAEKLKELIAEWPHDTVPVVCSEAEAKEAGVTSFYKHVCTKDCRRCAVEAYLAESGTANAEWTLEEYDSEQCEVMGEKESHIAFFPNTTQGRQHAQMLIAAGRSASGAQREPDPPGIHEHDDETGLCPECVEAGRKLAAPAGHAELSEALRDANGMCRSALSIAEREGISTNWGAFKRQLEKSLVVQQNALLRASQAGSKPAGDGQ